MRILYTTTIFPNTDGTSIFIQGLSENLNKLGNEAIIFTSNLKTSLKIESTKNYKINKIPYQAFDFFFKAFLKEDRYERRKNRFLNCIKTRINKLEERVIHIIQRVATKFTFPLIWGLFYDPFGWKLLLRILRLDKKKVDLIFTTPVGRSCIAASLIAGRIKKIPVVVKPAYHFMIRSYTFYDKNWANILNRFNLITTSTNAERDYLCKIGVQQNLMKTIGIGVPFNEINSAGHGKWREKLKISADKFVILYINNSIADRNKGIDLVIKAALKLPSIHFIFIGRYKEEWQEYVKIYKLNDIKNISYIEFVSDKEKYQIFNSVDLIVKPSINDSFGIVFFEGMSAGKPIITSNIKAMVEISKNVGLSVPNNNLNELIKSILCLKNDKVLYQKFSENAHIKSKAYAWDIIAMKYKLALKSLILKN